MNRKSHVNPASQTKRQQRRETIVHRFWRKRYKWVAVVGGLIVSISLTMKERLTEHVKEFSDAVETAQNFDTITEISDATDFRVEGLLRDIATRGSKEKTPSASVSMLSMNALKTAIDARTKQLHVRLNETERLIDKVPAQDYHSSLMAEAKKIVNLVESSARPWKADFAGSEPPDIDALNKQDEISLQITKLNGRTLNSLAMEKEKQERLLALVTWITYALLAVGFALSLSAKAFEGDEKSEELIPDVQFDSTDGKNGDRRNVHQSPLVRKNWRSFRLSSVS